MYTKEVIGGNSLLVDEGCQARMTKTIRKVHVGMTKVQAYVAIVIMA